MKTVYICERRRFDTLEDASRYAAKWFERYKIVVAITSKQVRA